MPLSDLEDDRHGGNMVGMVRHSSREPRVDVVQLEDSHDGEGHQGGDDPGGDSKEDVHKAVALDLSLRSCEAIVKGLDEKKKKQELARPR